MSGSPLFLGSTFPNIQGEAFQGVGKQRYFNLYEYVGNDKWCIFFSHPSDFTPVCTSELAQAAKMHGEFEKRNCKLVGFSCNNYESHESWSHDILHMINKSGEFPFPIIVDEKREVASQLGIMDPDEKDTQGLPLTCRSVFFLSPDKKVKSNILYPATTGRSFQEILRVLDSLQLTATYPLVTPEGWTPGARCVINPGAPEEDIKKKFKVEESVQLPSGKNYMNFTNDPTQK